MRKPALLLSIAVMFMVMSLVLGISYLGFKFSERAPSDQPNEVIYEVAPNKAFLTIAKDLEASGVITHATMFSWYARIKGDRNKIKVGEYLFRTNMKPSEVLSVLISGKSIERKWTVPEGLNMYEIADLYEKAGYGKKENFLALCKNQEFIRAQLGESQESLEGYLFPETYGVTKFTEAKTVIANMVHNFMNVYQEVTGGEPNWIGSRHQFVTYASLVEKESGKPEDRPLVASVFKNRLAKKMRLQTDPTILYGIIDATGEMKENITKADILAPTRYNTYTIDGLPPGPISNPGKESMMAALKPAETEYLYFVSRNDGTTQFSESLEQHNSSVQKFQVDPKAREGKSWRDLKKTK